jgi:MFS transporter, MHS family, proline/betaine transporter
MPTQPKTFLPIFGAALVWYDFALVGALAPTLSALFFPYDTALSSLLKLFAVFFIGFLARPLGAIGFGYWGDQIHRQTAFLYSIAIV